MRNVYPARHFEDRSRPPDVDFPISWDERWQMWLPDYDDKFMALAFPPRRRRISVLFDGDTVPEKVYSVSGWHETPQPEDPEFLRDCANLAEGSCPECRKPLTPGGTCCLRYDCSQGRLDAIGRDLWGRCTCCGLGWALGSDETGVWISREVNGHREWAVFVSHERSHTHPLGQPVHWTMTSWCPLPEDDIVRPNQAPGTESRLARSFRQRLAAWRSVGLWPADLD